MKNTDPSGVILGFVFDDFLPVAGGEETVSGKMTMRVGLDMEILDPKVLMILNSEEETPLSITGGPLDGMNLGFEAFTFYFSLSQTAIDPVGVSGTLLINGVPVDLDQPVFLDGSGVLEDGVIYNVDGMVIAVEGVSMDPLGLVLGFTFDEFSPVEGGEETVTGKFTLLAGVDMGLLDSKIKMILNTPAESPLTVKGGLLDGMTIGFQALTLSYRLSQASIDPVGMEGVLLVNGVPVDLDTLGGAAGRALESLLARVSRPYP
ncbi:hypothetical protein [Desulfoluna sp.]|uniref:hypothetical protein n=1 Tax=Desulfoluna sp. TaxID=2045199 RepID=UPI00261F4541|nr:hypothetical protein [Desulfoluna sp.]